MTRRPWWAYLLLVPGCLGLLVGLFRPMVGVTSTDPGAFAGPDDRLYVRPGSPMSRAGARTGDRFLKGETVELSTVFEGTARSVSWTRGIPRSGNVDLLRAEQTVRVQVRPAPPAWPVRAAWSFLGLLNAMLAALALALFWQRPRDGAAVLLGLILTSAPVFAFPGEPQLLALAFSAHFFTIFPGGAPVSRLRRFGRATLIYLPLAVFGLAGTTLWEAGQREGAGRVFHLLAFGYAGYGALRTSLKLRRSVPDAVLRPDVPRTLLIASLAILAAVAVGASQRLWVVRNQFIPLNLVPALIFTAAVGHLVFRLGVMRVRLVARRTIQYLLARWTLGAFFLLPGLLLVFHLGQASAGAAQGRSALPYLIWMAIVAVLHFKRGDVLRRLDRRFFKDEEARRERLLLLAREVGQATDTDNLRTLLQSGIREACGPLDVALTEAPEGPPPVQEGALRIPLVHRECPLGHLDVGPRPTREDFTSEERRLLEAVGAQAAVALNFVRISNTLLARQKDELALRSAGVLAGAEEERRRLAADLHDQVLPELRRLAAQAERLNERRESADPGLQELEQGIRQTMGSVREVMEALRPSSLDLLGLPDALESYLRKSAEELSPPPGVTVVREGEGAELTPEESLVLYRICQEAINNACKHSGARQLQLCIRGTGDAVEIRIRDDGCGLAAAEESRQGHGLRNMKYRADLIHASLGWLAPPGGGTEVVVGLRRIGEANTSPALGAGE